MRYQKPYIKRAEESKNADSDGAKIKVKETELVVADAYAFKTAKDMIDLREDQIERYNDYLKEQRSMRKR